MLIWLNESNVSNLLISTKFEAQHATWIKMSVSCINLKENSCSICPKKIAKGEDCNEYKACTNDNSFLVYKT